MNSYSLLGLIFLLYTLSITICKSSLLPLTRDRSTVIKGILSVLIIFSHVNFHADIPIFKTITNWGGTKVALFFFLSGYGLLISYSKVGSKYLDGFFIKRIWKIVKPLLAITLIYLLILYIDKGYFPDNMMKNLIMSGVTPLPYSWFVYVIIVVYIVFFFVFRLKIDINKKIFLSFLGVFLISFCLYKFGYDRAWWVSNLAFPTGMLYAYYEKKLIKISRTRVGNLLLIPLCALSAMAIVLPKIEFLYVFAYVFISIFLLVLISYVKLPNGKFWHFLGKISYETYLLHGAVFTMLRGELIFIENKYIYLLTTIVLTLVLAYVFNNFFNKKLVK